MGVFDKIKQAKEAVSMATMAGNTGAPGGAPRMPAGMPTDMEEQLRYRDLAQKLKNSGVEAQAVVKDVRPGEKSAFGDSIKTQVDVMIQPSDGDAYPATVTQALLPAMLDAISVGEIITVRYDPDNRTDALIYGGF